jgi:tRNA A-37 threonylcarbamoyl transferase component Bud32
MFGTLVYMLCAVTALLCAALLLRAYGRSGYRLLLWSGLCFAGLTINNVLLVLDKVILTDIDLSEMRSLAALMAMIVLIYGLIFDEG